MRISKDEYYMNIARAVSQRSTCLRRNYGAVIVNDGIIVSTGYNGSPVGCDNCCDSGYCYRSEQGIPSGERYEDCKAVHAEQNAMIQANYHDLKGSTLYLYGFDQEIGKEITGVPCKICNQMLLNAKVAYIVNNYNVKAVRSEDI